MTLPNYYMSIVYGQKVYAPAEIGSEFLNKLYLEFAGKNMWDYAIHARTAAMHCLN